MTTISILFLSFSLRFHEGLGLKLLAAEGWDSNEDTTLAAKWNLGLAPDGGFAKDKLKTCGGTGFVKYLKDDSANRGKVRGAAKAYLIEALKKCKPLVDEAKIPCMGPICAKAAAMESDTITGFQALLAKGHTATQSCSFYVKCVPTGNAILSEAGLGTWVWHSSVAGEFATWQAWAKNDPIVKNVAGEEFEILATGVFTMLTARDSESKAIMLEANATIDRAGTRCGATYIQDLSLKGEWVKDLGVPEIQIRAASAVPKNEALQVNFNGEWKRSSAKWFNNQAIRKSDAESFFLKLHELEIKVSIDSHRIHEGSRTTNRFANFLNVNFEGVSHLSDMLLGGLLGRDSHADAAKLPINCHSKTSKLLSAKDIVSMLSTALIT